SPRQLGPRPGADRAHGGPRLHHAALGHAGHGAAAGRAAHAPANGRRPRGPRGAGDPLQSGGAGLERSRGRARPPGHPAGRGALGGQHPPHPRPSLALDALRADPLGDPALHRAAGADRARDRPAAGHGLAAVVRGAVALPRDSRHRGGGLGGGHPAPGPAPLPDVDGRPSFVALLLSLGIVGTAVAYWAAAPASRLLPAVTTSLALLA